MGRVEAHSSSSSGKVCHWCLGRQGCVLRHKGVERHDPAVYMIISKKNDSRQRFAGPKRQPPTPPPPLPAALASACPRWRPNARTKPNARTNVKPGSVKLGAAGSTRAAETSGTTRRGSRQPSASSSAPTAGSGARARPASLRPGARAAGGTTCGSDAVLGPGGAPRTARGTNVSSPPCPR